MTLDRRSAWVAAIVFLVPAALFAGQPHSLILFVPDGLRAGIVDAQTAPTMARLRDEGVNFVNSHSLFPTFTTANASALATGHALGDTGDFSNVIYTGFPVQAAGGSVTPFLENDAIFREIDQHFAGNYLHEESIVAVARAGQQRMSTALLGKPGPAAIFDLKAIDGSGTLIVDDSTGHPGGVPLSPEWQKAIQDANLSLVTPDRGDNGNPGNSRDPGTWVPGYAQQQYFLEITTKVILPRFKAAGRPFMLVYWSRDPDGTQHTQGDSFDALRPGINGPTSLSAIRAADAALASIEQALKSLGLAESTNIIVAADHGFSTISKESQSSGAARAAYPDVIASELPVGFLAIDLASALHQEDAKIQLFDPESNNAPKDWTRGEHPKRGNALIGADPSSPQVIIAANGGSDLIYIPASLAKQDARHLAEKLVATLIEQDYVSGLFVDQRRFGEIAGALALGDIGLDGKAVLPKPSIVVSFRSFATGCGRPELCAAEVADTYLQQGQGMHGSLSRADTWNFMAARGPDFRDHYLDLLPASNADIGRTIAHILQLDSELKPQGALEGRILSETLAADDSTETHSLFATRRVITSKAGPGGAVTLLELQQVGKTVYLDAGGFPGRTVGLE